MSTIIDRMAYRGTQQLRKGRVSQACRIYHITTATQDRKSVFASLVNGRIVILALKDEQASGNASTLAFVVMPDHLHWLLQLPHGKSLSTCVGRVKSASARLINRRTRRKGRLWQDGFHDRAIRRDEDIVHIARYIVANPIRAGIVSSIRHYPHWYAVWL